MKRLSTDAAEAVLQRGLVEALQDPSQGRAELRQAAAQCAGRSWPMANGQRLLAQAGRLIAGWFARLDGAGLAAQAGTIVQGLANACLSVPLRCCAGLAVADKASSMEPALAIAAHRWRRGRVDHLAQPGRGRGRRRVHRAAAPNRPTSTTITSRLRFTALRE